MNCVCGSRLRVTRTVQAGAAGKVSEATCPKCLRTFVAVTAIVQEQGAYGSGPHAIAAKLARGELKLQVGDGDGDS